MAYPIRPWSARFGRCSAAVGWAVCNKVHRLSSGTLKVGFAHALPPTLPDLISRCSAVDAAHAEVFDFEKFLDAVFRAFAADAAFLHAAEGGDLGRDDAFVDADDAVFEGFGDAPDAADVAAVEIGGETEFGVVGHLDGLVFGLEPVERRDGAKGLRLGD